MRSEDIAGAGHGTLNSYVIGFGLAIVLTVIPFAFVMTRALPHGIVIPLIIVFAVVQIIVHLVFFLHMNGSSEQQWNALAFAYTIIVLGILVGASIWIMYHLDFRMMVGLQ